MASPSFHGLLVVDKPAGMTSRDVVDRSLRWFPRGTRMGHTGTLDPLATGVLVLCVGVATRLTEFVQRMTKTYRAGIVLGATSDTADADGVITPVPVEDPPDRGKVEQALRTFIGEIEQVPPAYSAARVAGRRAYDLARGGEEVSLSARPVHIHRIDVLTYEYPRLEIEVRCGKGTYIRSLARDLGERLGCGGYIAELRRTQVGCFEAADALSLDAERDTAQAKILPIEAAVRDLPAVTLRPAEEARLRQGQRLPASGSAWAEAAEVQAVDESGKLIAICAVEGDQLRPVKVIPRP